MTFLCTLFFTIIITIFNIQLLVSLYILIIKKKIFW